MTLVDTNVLLDVLTDDPRWYDWSATELSRAALRGPLLVNDVVLAELSTRYEQIEEVDAAIAELSLEHVEMPRLALFAAAKVFQVYRKRGGTRTGVLPDFFIGAHAAAAGLPLLTRDARRYQTYFPTVELIAPDP